MELLRTWDLEHEVREAGRALEKATEVVWAESLAGRELRLTDHLFAASIERKDSIPRPTEPTRLAALPSASDRQQAVILTVYCQYDKLLS